MKLMKLTRWERNGEGAAIYFNPAAVFGIYRSNDHTYIDDYTTENGYLVAEPAEEVARIWEEAVNG